MSGKGEKITARPVPPLPAAKGGGQRWDREFRERPFCQPVLKHGPEPPAAENARERASDAPGLRLAEGGVGR
jgi:hypothetical protein